MEEWKQAIWLAKFEFKHSLKNFVFLFGILIVILLIVRSFIPSYFEEPAMGLDIYFVFFMFSGLAPLFSRPRYSQLQNRGGLFYAAPFLVNLNQLPIKKGVIVKYKFLNYLVIVSISNIILLIGLYPAFKDVMTLNTYFIFSIIWFCFSIYLGCSNPTFEAASNLGWNIFYAAIFSFPLFFSYVFLFYKWYPNGLVSWTIDMAANQPVLSMIISVVLAGVSWNFWMKMMQKRMTKADYF